MNVFDAAVERADGRLRLQVAERPDGLRLYRASARPARPRAADRRRRGRS